MLELNGKSILKETNDILDQNDVLLDKDWVRTVFLLNRKDYDDDIDVSNRTFTTATLKYTDTTMGGNHGVNARPQFTRYSDIRNKGRIANRNDVSVTTTEGKHGMGRYYSESIDDNTQTIWLTFGVAEHSPLTTFLSRAFDTNASKLANTGRGLSIATSLGVVAGKVLQFKTLKVVGLGRLASTAIKTVKFLGVKKISLLLLLYYGGKILRDIVPNSSSKYYTLKPTMYTYWSAVNNLVSDITVNLGIMPNNLQETLRSGTDNTQAVNTRKKIDDDYMESLKDIFPDIITENNFIDVYRIATRANRILDQEFKRNYEFYSSDKEQDYVDYVKNKLVGFVDENTTLATHSFVNYIQDVFDFTEFYDSGLEDQRKNRISERNNNIREFADDLTSLNDGEPISAESVFNDLKGSLLYAFASGSDNFNKIKSYALRDAEGKLNWLGQAKTFYSSELRDGSRFASFKVNYTGSTSESFSSSVKESGVASILNSTSGTTRSLKFNLGGGNLGDNFVANVAESIVSTLSEFASGALSSYTFGLSNIAGALMGGGYIDVPKVWENSTVTLPKMDYTLKLISPYNNPISQIQNIYLPLSMLMVGALPLATGKASYTSPFLCSLFDRGHTNVELGIIDSLSVTRGSSNLGFTNRGVPLAIDVSFSVLDLSSIVHMPISNGSLFGVNLGLDEDNIISKYLKTLVGLDLYSQFYFAPKTKLRMAKKLFNKDRFHSPAGWAMFASDQLVVAREISKTISLFSGTNNGIRDIDSF